MSRLPSIVLTVPQRTVLFVSQQSWRPAKTAQAWFVASGTARCYIVRMAGTARGSANSDPVNDDARRLTDAERADLLASLEASRAEYASGRYHVLKPGMLREEFEAILEGDPSDAELDALLGIVRPESP